MDNMIEQSIQQAIKLANFSQQKINDGTFSKSKCYDGHFWVERDGVIIDSDNSINHLDFMGGKKVYKKASILTNKLLIEKHYRSLEDCMKLKRNNPNFINYFKTYVNVRDLKCFENALIEVYNNGGEIVAGCVGYYFENGNTHYRFECPPKSVFWKWGCGKHKVLNDFYQENNNFDFETYWTFEKIIKNYCKE